MMGVLTAMMATAQATATAVKPKSKEPVAVRAIVKSAREQCEEYALVHQLRNVMVHRTMQAAYMDLWATTYRSGTAGDHVYVRRVSQSGPAV